MILINLAASDKTPLKSKAKKEKIGVAQKCTIEFRQAEKELLGHHVCMYGMLEYIQYMNHVIIYLAAHTCIH